MARKILGRGTEEILSGQKILFSVAYRQKQGSFGNFRNANRQIGRAGLLVCIVGPVGASNAVLYSVNTPNGWTHEE